MWQFDQFADNIAIITENGSEISYAELMCEGSRLADTVGKRCLVFVLCRNEKGSILGYVSFLNHNIVPLMLSADIDREMLDVLVDIYMPDFLWLPADMEAVVGEYESVHTAWDYSLYKTKHISAFPMSEELALLLTTSGSTGSPKLVRLSYRNIQSNAESIVQYLELNATERPITTLPMSYTYGLSIINSHLLVGASIILTQKTLMEKEFWSHIKDYGATSLGGVPYIYEMLDKLRFFRMDLPALQTMTQAGGKLSPELHKKFAEHAEKTGRRFVVMYGQTEATARMSYLPYEKALEKCGSMGIAIPGGEFLLIDVNGDEITDNDIVGELVYKGDNVMLGYAERGADLIKGDEMGGVLITGDMAKRDADGFYYIVGRKKRFLKIFGSRINLDETERLLRVEFQGFECACGGVDDKMTVYITDGGASADVIRFLAGKTGLNNSAFRTVEVSEIPRNEAGKTLYSELNRFDDQ